MSPGTIVNKVHIFEHWDKPKIPTHMRTEFTLLESGAIVHRTARVDEGAFLGKGVIIWHFSHVTSTATIGDYVSVGQGCFVAGRVGRYTHIQNNVSIWKEVTIASECFVGPGVQFTNAHRPNPPYRALPVPTTIETRCAICAGAILIAPLLLQKESFVAAGAVVRSGVYKPKIALVGCPATESPTQRAQNNYHAGRKGPK
jgi:UDP-2-acetamido-3-amino-2,3-dideoxy-glucuronate N-acetyltransferase